MSRKIAKSKIVDMTVGSTMRHLLLFAAPLLVGNVFQQLYNLVDSLIVGRFVGANALAAVGTCGSISFLFFALCSGLANGVGVIVAQKFGAKKEKDIRITIGNSIYVISGIALVVTVLGIVFPGSILRLIGTPQSILSDATRYLQIVSAGIVGVAVFNGVSAIMRSLGDSKTPLYFLIVSSLINVSLDLLFVIVFGLGVFGVAVATVIAQYASAIACLIYAIKKVEYFKLTLSEMKPNRDVIETAFILGIPMSLQMSIIAVSCMALQRVVNSFGETVIAAFTITNRIEQIIQQPYSSLSTGITTFSGQNLGANNIGRVKDGFKKGTIAVLTFSIVMLPVMYIFGESIVGIFVNDATVIATGAKALRITSVAYFALGMVYVPRAVLNGCGDSKFALINGITEVLCRIGFSQLLLRIPALGCWIIWMTNAFTWTVTGIVCVLRYKKGAWKHISLAKKLSGNKALAK